MPEGGLFPCHVVSEGKDVRPIAENGKEERGGKPMAEEIGRPIPGGESLLMATKAAWALARRFVKWVVVDIEGVNQ